MPSRGRGAYHVLVGARQFGGVWSLARCSLRPKRRRTRRSPFVGDQALETPTPSKSRARPWFIFDSGLSRCARSFASTSARRCACGASAVVAAPRDNPDRDWCSVREFGPSSARSSGHFPVLSVRRPRSYRDVARLYSPEEAESLTQFYKSSLAHEGEVGRAPAKIDCFRMAYERLLEAR